MRRWKVKFGVGINNREEIINSAINYIKVESRFVVVSTCGEGALLVSEDGIYQGKPPKIEAVNTVGCGDSMVAAFAVGFERGYSPVESLKYAVSVSTANALTSSTGSFIKEDAYKKFFWRY